MKTIGLVTIGQSPRVDLTPDLQPLWQDQFEIMEMGALDDLSPEAIQQLAPKADETVLVSRLRSGGCARLGEERIIPLVQQKIDDLQSQAQGIFLLCTGEFPPLASKIPLFEPDLILRKSVSAILKPHHKLGVMVPEMDQQADIIKRWAKHVPNQVITDYGTPYGQDWSLLEAAAKRLKDQPVDYIVLDCLGYSQAMKAKVQQITGKPVVIPRTLVAHLIAAIF